jgi:hypothetical protein
LLRHDARLVAPFRARLAKAGWDILRARTSELDLEADLVAVKGAHCIIIEAKTNRVGDDRHQIRYAIGQLMDYEYFLLPRLLGKAPRKASRLILLEREPRPELTTFAEDSGFLIAWRAKGQIRAGPVTHRQLGALVG